MFESIDFGFELDVCVVIVSFANPTLTVSVEYEGADNVPGMTSSIFRGERLNGSLGSLRRMERMVDLSTELREVGKMTGSSISVASTGSIIRKGQHSHERSALATGEE